MPSTAKMSGLAQAAPASVLTHPVPADQVFDMVAELEPELVSIFEDEDIPQDVQAKFSQLTYKTVRKVSNIGSDEQISSCFRD